MIFKRLAMGKKSGFSCDKCNDQFTIYSDLSEHMLSKHVSSLLFHVWKNCCNKTFTSDETLRKHQLNHKTDHPFQCEQCRKSFTTAGVLKTHMGTHTGEKPFTCNECGNRFTQKGSLTEHMRIHSGERPFKCNECERAFIYSGDLRKHRRAKHSTERPFKCDLCAFAAAQSGDLKRHLACHDLERKKQHTCEKCENTFATKVTLRKHTEKCSGYKMTHRKNICDVCNKIFKISDTLKSRMKKHMLRIHSEERPHKCEICGNAYKTKATLKEHLKYHGEERPYVCEICSKGFKTSTKLKVRFANSKLFVF